MHKLLTEFLAGHTITRIEYSEAAAYEVTLYTAHGSGLRISVTSAEELQFEKVQQVVTPLRRPE